MRAFTKKNKGSFVIFAVLIFATIAALSFAVIKYVTAEDNQIQISAGSVIYADDDKIYEIENGATLTKKWDKKYYLKDSNNTNVCVGINPLIYETQSSALNIMGESYRVYPDGTTIKLTNGSNITNTNETQFYKLQDRYYVFVGSKINSYKEGFSASNFMKIKIAKNGNALLQSIGLNSKTISEQILVCEDWYFDIAAEILYCNGVETNLRKIIGSTNEYDGAPILYKDTGIERPETSTANERIPDIEEYNITAGTGGTGGLGGDAGNGGHGGNAGSGGPGGIGGTGGTGGDGGETRQDTTNYVSLVSATPGITSIDIAYTVNDPNDAIAKMTLNVYPFGEPETNAKTYIIDKYDAKYTVFDLKPNTKYVAKLYSAIYEEKSNDRFYPGTLELKGQTIVSTGMPTATISTNRVASKTVRSLTGEDEVITYVSLRLDLSEGFNFLVEKHGEELTYDVSELTVYGFKVEDPDKPNELTPVILIDKCKVNEDAINTKGQIIEFTIDDPTIVGIEVDKVHARYMTYINNMPSYDGELYLPCDYYLDLR